MLRTVDEKVAYNKGRKTEFSRGYCLGVSIYRDYSKGDDKGKKIVKDFITSSKELAQDGDIYCKGLMCGVRDAANERKARQKRK